MTHNLTGQSFGHLVVIERAPNKIGPNGKPRSMWLCQCDLCGNVKPVLTDSLVWNRQRSCGCQKAQAALMPGYVRMHQRVREANGHATGYRCVDCGEQAQEWSYDGTDPDEVRGVHGLHVLPYSLKLAHYEPRCVKCHRNFDSPLKAGES
ncbi:hypothetical protein VD659_16175 [Herbiconiux sp. 11R-BC]|uniref:hypothetical protein n=1 Tax=Herbiconiux sp. 11R-BC TaxID=3111637 RepID=UPI003C0FBB54